MREALEVLDRERPDVILCDMGMPQHDGLAFIQQLRTSPSAKAQQVPAAALTAYTRPEDRVRALEAGLLKRVSQPIRT